VCRVSIDKSGVDCAAARSGRGHAPVPAVASKKKAIHFAEETIGDIWTYLRGQIGAIRVIAKTNKGNTEFSVA